MKFKASIVLMLLCACSIAGVVSHQEHKEKLYTVSMPLQDWINVSNIIDQSNAGHVAVKYYSDEIAKQVNAQQDTSTVMKGEVIKPVADSSASKTKKNGKH